MSMTPVRPAAPITPWLGGKSKLAKTIIERIDHIPHKTYVEPFVGMGGVFLRRGFRPACEVANDLNGDVVTLFRVLQHHRLALLDYMKYQVASRSEFDRLKDQNPELMTDIQRAARFLYLMRQSFGGKVGSVFGVSPGHSPRFSLARLEPILEEAYERIDGVVFEQLDWSELVRRYDTDSTLFYLDPPYHGGENDYGKGMFSRSDFVRMADLLRGIKGSFLLSINDVPEIRQIFDGFILDEVRLTYTVSKGAGKKVGELIISNREVVPGLL